MKSGEWIPLEVVSTLDRHRYLRAYTAGIALPTLALLVVMAVFTVARFHYEISVPNIIVFPMALIPNLWGVWNMLYVVLKDRFRLPIGLHGAGLVILIGGIGYGFARLNGVEPPPWAAFGPLAALVGYYLAWNYVVGFLNRALDVE